MATPSQDSLVVVPLSNTEEIVARIDQLKEALQHQSPGYESLLHTIHRNLLNNPDTVHLLTEEQIGIICSGLQKRTGIFIANAEAEKVVKVGKKGGKVSVEDL